MTICQTSQRDAAAGGVHEAKEHLAICAQRLLATRPTAVNLRVGGAIRRDGKDAELAQWRFRNNWSRWTSVASDSVSPDKWN